MIVNFFLCKFKKIRTKAMGTTGKLNESMDLTEACTSSSTGSDCGNNENSLGNLNANTTTNSTNTTISTTSSTSTATNSSQNQANSANSNNNNNISNLLNDTTSMTILTTTALATSDLPGTTTQTSVVGSNGKLNKELQFLQTAISEAGISDLYQTFQVVKKINYWLNVEGQHF